MIVNIAIDGPAGAGKSTIAKRVAKELSFIYVDTGAMYRAMALYLLREGVSASQPEQIARACENAKITIVYEDGDQRILLCGEDVTPCLRTEEVGNMASVSSAHPRVREKLVELQQRLAAERSVVMDGRDIGTVVLPDAAVKIYLTASAHIRALRRFAQLEQKGENPSLLQIEKDIADRDTRDMTREISPLRQAEDAILVDSSELGIEEVVEKILEIFRERTGERCR
ncbi:MAG: (d)CMP kinase [Eubacteriales bacterium]|nr:(d)CMP kinase [Eubacteriales bacterium]